MTSLCRLIKSVLVLLLIAGWGAGALFADSGHARIVRLSLVQGDVRFARDVKGDPLTDSRGSWELAVLNLPIRQGYVLATDNGRAEVEFENGAMAFLAENTVLEFYDLSSEDGGFTTRLILRQGSAAFYVHPGRTDYFSVTGGDFSVQAEKRTTFRMNNFDDGSSVSVIQGELTALTNGKNTVVEKDQSLSVRAGEQDSAAVERAPASDEFDQWVSGRIDTVNTATVQAAEYSNSSGYTSGFADLYNYGAWFPVAGYGNCWRPYGVGFGWSPFDYGSWYFDPLFGWSFIGGQMWGWLPYHYGGWLFRPGVGWVWSPAGSFGAGGVGRWRPVTGVWVRSGGSVGIVPRHPLDGKGKTPLNLPQGVFAVTSRGVSGRVATDENSPRWKVENKPARDVMQSQLTAATAPARVERSMAAAAGATVSTGSHAATGDRDSTIIYDRTERRFVNSDAPKPTVSAGNAGAAENTEGKPAAAPAQGSTQGQTQGQARVRVYPEQNRSGNAQAPPASNRVNGREGQTASVPGGRRVSPPRPPAAPPSVPRSVTNERVFSGSGASNGGNSRAGAGASSGPAPRASAPSSSGSSARSSSNSGGGRPR